MNANAISEVYSIINIMDNNYRKRIPESFMDFLNNNRNITYCPKFKKIPENFDLLEHDTQVIFAIICKKFFPEIYIERQKLIQEKNNTAIAKRYNNGFERIIAKIKKFFKKLIKR